MQNVQNTLIDRSCDVNGTQVLFTAQVCHQESGAFIERPYEALQNAEVEAWLDQTSVAFPLLSFDTKMNVAYICVKISA
jgi:hypothetical protein